MPYKNSRKLSLIYLSFLLVTLSTEIELNPGPSLVALVALRYWMMILPYLVTIVNIGTTFSDKTYQLELMIPYRLVMCPSHGCV